MRSCRSNRSQKTTADASDPPTPPIAADSEPPKRLARSRWKWSSQSRVRTPIPHRRPNCPRTIANVPEVEARAPSKPIRQRWPSGPIAGPTSTISFPCRSTSIELARDADRRVRQNDLGNVRVPIRSIPRCWATSASRRETKSSCKAATSRSANLLGARAQGAPAHLRRTRRRVGRRAGEASSRTATGVRLHDPPGRPETCRRLPGSTPASFPSRRRSCGSRPSCLRTA